MVEVTFDIKIFKGFWKVKDTIENPAWLFVFGDNDKEIIRGGQAIIRNRKNAIGLSTNTSWYSDYVYYTDAELRLNKMKIRKNIKKIWNKVMSGAYTTLVLPENGFGTGLSKLSTKTPRTLKYLNRQIVKLALSSDCTGISDMKAFEKTYGYIPKYRPT